MPQYFAFLRAINVGGRTVKMDVLRAHFQALGFDAVESFIASGNIIFSTPNTDLPALTHQIETHLQQTLGYTVPTFLRTLAQIHTIASYQPFSPPEMQSAAALNVMFMASPLTASEQVTLANFETEIDRFHTHQTEIYWLCRNKQSESMFSNALLEKQLKQSATMRTLNTVARLAAKYPLTTQ